MPRNSNCPELSVVTAQLDDGRIVKIDNASQDREIKQAERYEYLGMGVHVYNHPEGRVEYGKNKYHFFKLKEDTP